MIYMTQSADNDIIKHKKSTTYYSYLELRHTNKISHQGHRANEVAKLGLEQKDSGSST